MTNISVTNALDDNSATSDITLVGTNFDDVINGLTDGTKDISISQGTFASKILMADGAVTAPGYAFTNDTDCGLYRIGANNIGFATDGTKSWEVDSSQNLIVAQDFYTTAWTDYSATSTITGWSGTPNPKKVMYKKIGNLVYVMFDISGTSDSTTTSFTVANTSVTLTGTNFANCALTTDNGTATTTGGLVNLPNNSTTVTVYKDMTGTATDWTNSGIKSIRGILIYEAAT